MGKATTTSARSIQLTASHSSKDTARITDNVSGKRRGEKPGVDSARRVV